MSTRIATYPADVVYESAWNVGPLQSNLPPLWTNISARATGPWSTTHGLFYEGGRVEAGELHPVLDNRDGGLDPSNAAGPYAPNVVPYRRLRIRMPFGPNLLSVDQATAGQYSGFVGAVPPQMNIVNDFGYPLTIVNSGSAFQGSTVYQAVLPNGATANSTVLLVKPVPVVPGQGVSFQAQCRIPSGNSVSTNAALLFYDLNGNSVSSVGGTAQTLTSGSSTWVQLSSSATVPSNAYSVWLKVEIASGTLTGSTTWQVDGLQFEQSLYPTPFQVPQTVSANLLPRAIATSLSSISPVTDSAANWFYPAIGSVAIAQNLTAAPTGATTAVAWTSPIGTTNASALWAGAAGTNAPATGPVADCVQVTAGQQYTVSAYFMRVSSADATVQVQVGVRWFDASGNTLSSTNSASVTVPVGSWSARATVTGTAPAGAVWARPRYFIATPASTTASNTIYATGWQLEQAGAASAWVDPGYTGYAFTGYFEQFPQMWRLSETWGELEAVGVDALAGLAQYTVQDPLIEELLLLGPTFLYALNDPAGSSSCVDVTGNRTSAPVENSPYGVGSLTFGNSVTSATAAGAMQGTAGPVATFNNNPSETGSLQFPETFVSLHKASVVPGPPSNGGWTRVIHFRSAAAPGANAAYILWNAIPPSYGVGSNSQVMFQLQGPGGPAGAPFLLVSGATGGTPSYSGPASLCDGNWHQLAISCDGSGNVAFYVDGTQVGTGSITLPVSGIAADVVGASVQLGANIYKGGYVGDAAFVAEFPAVLTPAQFTNLYNSFRSASTGESSGARASRLLRWIGWSGPTQIDTGLTTSMGPATDLVGQSGLDGLDSVATTENGLAFATLDGRLRFMGRNALYNSSPVYVFGERQQYGEWPYEDAQLPVDPIQTYNIIPVQQYSTGQVATAQDLASQQNNWPRTLPTRVVNTSSFAEAQSAAAYLLAQYKTPRLRCSSMTLHPSSIPGLFQVCAQLEIGTRIRIMKRPPWRATAIQFDGFVQRLEWSLSPQGDVTLRIEASPADLQNYWTLAALHTTLNAQAASGQNQATINALPDAAVNKLAQSLPQGYQLTFEPGTARAETMTLSPTGIPSTSLGYATAVLTFTSNFAFTHPANSVVCEPLPTGYTDPTTWDANSVIGAAYTTVVSGGASGTNTVTVGALQDAAVNPLGSNWNTNDQITLSPGTPNAETMTIQSVAATLPGYTSCQITFTANLAHSHTAGDYACDPLPAGVNSPTALAPTARTAY